MPMSPTCYRTICGNINDSESRKKAITLELKHLKRKKSELERNIKRYESELRV